MKNKYSKEGYQKMIAASAKGRKTQAEQREILEEQYRKNPKQCLNCKVTIPYELRATNIYCSHSCRAKTVNKTRNRKDAKKKKHCLNCNVLTNNPKFCSTTCSAQFKKFNIEDWIQGKVSGTIVSGCSLAIRNYLIQLSNNQCSKCKWAEVHPITNKVPLEINHIDGNSKNNSKENLEVLCPNCHSLTLNFRALNKNSKRNYRKNRNDRI